MFKFTRRTRPIKIFNFYFFCIKLGNKPKEETIKDHLFINSQYMSYSVSYLCHSLDGTTMFFPSKPWNNCMNWEPSNLLVFFSYGWLHNDTPPANPKQLFNQVNVCAKSSFLLLICFIPLCFPLSSVVFSTIVCCTRINDASSFFFFVYYPVPARMAQLFQLKTGPIKSH